VWLAADKARVVRFVVPPPVIDPFVHAPLGAITPIRSGKPIHIMIKVCLVHSVRRGGAHIGEALVTMHASKVLT
jgi:hypothetical protein